MKFQRIPVFFSTALLLLTLPGVLLARPVLSPGLRAMNELAPGEAPLQAIPMSDLPGIGTVVDVFLEGNVSDADLAVRGIVIGSRLPNGTITAKVPLARLADVINLPGLQKVSAAHKVRLHMNVSVPNTQATPNFWMSSPPNFTGQAGTGVVVGIVDSGIDWTHDDFKNPDGTTRILNVWDQNDLVGPSPPGFGYGSHWTSADINLATPRHTDTNGHGTHVSGTAAGDGSATGNGEPAHQFIGMAPRADIIMVATNFSTAGVVDGVNFVFQRAAALGRPAVVNLSLGTQFGAHDGTETMDTSISALTGPGKIVVCSAGNDGNQSLHAEQLVPPGPAQTVTFSVPAYTANIGAGNDYVLIDAYYQGSADMSVTLTSPGPSPVTVGPVVKGATGSNAGSLAGNIYIENGFTPSPSGDANIYIQIYDSISSRPPRQGTWTITLTPVSTTASTECDLWHAGFQLGSAFVQPLFTSDVDEAELVGSPGSAAQAIAVAAFTTKTVWPSIDGNNYQFVGNTPVGTLAGFSSPGPNRDGAQKPDITAPGTAIVSSLSADAASPNALINPDGVHWTLQGTSMSSPHVAGGVALILAASPLMTPAQMKTRLAADALVDGNTGAVPNPMWGYGKLRMLNPDSTPPTVSVTSPNGGEVWATGSSQDITWTASDDIGVTLVDIDYSIDNGSSWTSVATGEANDGTYGWLVPNTPSTQALVRVTAWDGAGNSAPDASDAAFTIADQTPPSVTVLVPNGGETWSVGTVQPITWTATDEIGVVSVDIDYSANNGTDWIVVASSEPNDGSYDWTIPAPATTQALVRVTARDAAGNEGTDQSDAVFQIIEPDMTPPMVTVTSPNGGESWAVGSTQPITWTATDSVGVTSIDIDYSTDNGGSWTSVATGEANDGSYDWLVPNTPSTQALVRVTAWDASTNSAADQSDSLFTIFVPDLTPPAVTVIQPNGGETLLEGSVYEILWTATDSVGVTSIDIDYSTDNGGSWTSVATGEANDGSYDWTVPNTTTTDALVRVTAHDAASNSGQDQSDAVFTISSTSASPFLPAALTRPMVLQNRPNPFNPTTRIGFALPEPGRVVIRVYSLKGHLVRNLVDREFGSGYAEVLWDGTSDAGQPVTSGIYFYRFASGKTVETKRLVVSK